MRDLKLAAAFGAALLISGCVHKTPEVRRTQVITFPEGGIVEYNGRELGRAPALITLPQDEQGRLTERAVVRAIPKNQPELAAGTRILEPGERGARVPDRIMISMKDYTGTNATEEARMAAEDEPRVKSRFRYIPRSKPTQVIGIDRKHMRDTLPRAKE